MICDANLQLSGTISGSTVTGQSLAQAAGTYVSTNVVDLGTNRDIGEGEDVWGRFEILVAGVGMTSVEMQLVSADDAAISTNVTVLGTTGAVPLASLTAGARFIVDPRPLIGSKGQRYVAARYVIVGTGTAGTVFADLGVEIQDGQKFYPSGFAVS